MSSNSAKVSSQKARDFDEAQTAQRNAASLAFARYLTDVNERLRKQDFQRFTETFSGLNRKSKPEVVKAAMDQARLIVSGDADLTARFDEFIVNARFISTGVPPGAKQGDQSRPLDFLRE